VEKCKVRSQNKVC